MSKFDHLEAQSEQNFDSDGLTGTTSSPESDSNRDDATGSEFASELVYDLRSDRFYADVCAFSTRVVEEIESRASAALDGYSRYVTERVREAPRSRGEYALELLTVGMALRLYGEVAARTPGMVMDLARELYWLRRRSPRIKPIADFLRAGLFQIFMKRKPQSLGAEALNARARARAERASSLSNLSRLIEWLQATGEFEQESRRLVNWRSNLRQMPSIEAEGWIAIAVSLFDWFAREADSALGTYTKGVMHFLETTYAARFWREDQIFCGRLPAEYHLGMVAAEVMNDGLREEFNRRPIKILLVPTCLRGEHSDECKALVRGLDMTCTGCDPKCAVNRITRRMREQGVRVFMVPHTTGFSRWLERWQQDPRVGVAAVACLMNILPGGYEMRARGIASQCVPLDFPGCQKHWTGLPTAVNEERLAEIVREPEP
jgi:uncharacterized protein